jgi:acyl dehydratase
MVMNGNTRMPAGASPNENKDPIAIVGVGCRYPGPVYIGETVQTSACLR